MGKSGAYKEDSEKAKKHVYANNGKGPCPYPNDTRPARLWAKWQGFYLQMESQFDDLALAYGEFRSDRLGSTEHSKEPER